ncbi:hypothetical protein [Paraburkholderia sediminicola]|uniref:hypothetical protein n=1 Tax=Paraburkholderia sediminicola TaxID=458836 RepID=UPI0038BCC491
MPGKQSWWVSLPGILAAVGGLIVAVTGLVVALNPSPTPTPIKRDTSQARPDSPPAPAVAPSAPPAPPPQAKLLEKLFTVPIHSSLQDAKSRVPSLEVLSSGGNFAIQYRQDFLGLPVRVIENLDAELITQEARVIATQSASETHMGLFNEYVGGDPVVSVYPFCFGEKYTKMVQTLIENFGLPKEYSPTQWIASDEVKQDFVGTVLSCKVNGQCSTYATKRQQKRVFQKDSFGEITFTATLAHIKRKRYTTEPTEDRADETENSCEWFIEFMPKH